ncbi:multiheme c-type cytochrome, partial [Eggerthella sp. 1_3_56FAA]
MTVQAHTADRRLVVLAVLGVVLALTAAMWTLAGCAPKAEPSAPAASEQKDGNGGSSAMDGQPVNWTMDSDCSMCHTVEAASATDASCPQASAHEAEGVTCVQCHTDEAALSTEHADVKFGDKAATKATVVTVDPETCISCHGTMEEMAAKTADSTALTDDKGTTVNP